MKRLALLLLAVSVLCLALCTQYAEAQSSSASALSGIEDAHRQDIAATFTQNPAQLVALWTDDSVLIGEGDAPVVGKAQIESQLKQGFASH